jgi:hypothetical protein
LIVDLGLYCFHQLAGCEFVKPGLIDVNGLRDFELAIQLANEGRITISPYGFPKALQNNN